jgi:histone-arginine methyltransferase CARM1
VAPAAKTSVFDATREKSSSTEYFNYYALLSQQQNMLSDLTRTGTYQRAVLANSVDFQGKVVCDVGAGMQWGPCIIS